MVHIGFMSLFGVNNNSACIIQGTLFKFCQQCFLSCFSLSDLSYVHCYHTSLCFAASTRHDVFIWRLTFEKTVLQLFKFRYIINWLDIDSNLKLRRIQLFFIHPGRQWDLHAEWHQTLLLLYQGNHASSLPWF